MHQSNGANPTVALTITAREKDLGGFSVRRILPYQTHRAVGPFVFFDHMGPATFAPGAGINVRPHPHINLATVTYLFAGRIRHRDSLGTDVVIEPGAVNWMTAGRGIVHSERTPPETERAGGAMHGIQLWVALPTEHEECAPSFAHHPRADLPEFTVGDVKIKLLLGRAFGKQSPVRVHSDLYYLEAFIPAGGTLALDADGRDHAAYVVTGSVNVDAQATGPATMIVFKPGAPAGLRAETDAHVMLLGGSPVGERFMYWNFISSSKDRLEEAKRDWAKGPAETSARFVPVPGDDHEFIPLPTVPKNLKGTAL